MDLRNSTFERLGEPNPEEEDNLITFDEEKDKEDLQLFRDAGLLNESNVTPVTEEKKLTESVTTEKPKETIAKEEIVTLDKDKDKEDIALFKEAGLIQEPTKDTKPEETTAPDWLRYVPGADMNEKPSWANLAGFLPGGQLLAKEDIRRGAKISAYQTPEVAYGVVGLVGETAKQLTGYGETVANWGFKGAEDWNKKTKPISKETDDVSVAWNRAKEGDVQSLVDWTEYATGYALGQLAETGAMALLGGAAAGAVAAPAGPEAAVPAAGVGAAGATVAKSAFKTGVKNLVEKAIASRAKKIVLEEATKQGVKFTEREIAEQAAKEGIKQMAAKQIGSDAAIFANSIGMELGSIYVDAKTKAQEEGRELNGTDLAWIWGTGIAAGGIEGLTDKLGLEALGGKFSKILPKNAATRAAVAAGIGVVGEAGTEVAQTALERYGAGKDVLSDEAINEYINAGAMGAAGGGVIGGAGGILSETEAPVQRNTVNNKINEIETLALKEEEKKAKREAGIAADPTQTATERLQNKTREFEQKNIPNQALKVVEGQIEQTKGTPAAPSKTAEDILAEKAADLDKTDIQAVELDEDSSTRLKKVTNNTASKEDVKVLKDKGHIYEVEGQLVIKDNVRLGMGKDSPQMSEKSRLEEIRDRFTVTNEELNNSTDAELFDALNRGKAALPKLTGNLETKAKSTIDSIANELVRRANAPMETTAGTREAIDNRSFANLDTEDQKSQAASQKVTESINQGKAVELVSPKAKSVQKVVGYDNTEKKFIVKSDKTGKQDRVPFAALLNGDTRMEVYDPTKARSRQGLEITGEVTQKITPLPVARKVQVVTTEEMKSTPIAGNEAVEDTTGEIQKKAETLKNLNATNATEFLNNISKKGGAKGKVAELLLKIASAKTAKINIGRFGRSKEGQIGFAGKYNKKTNEITINLDERDEYTNEDGTHDVESTLLHELGHAGFFNKLNSKETLDPAEAKAISELEKIYNDFVKKYSDTKGEYNQNTQNVFNPNVGFQEFISELLVNKELQGLVDGMSPDKTLLQKVLQYILNFIQGKELNPYNELSQAWKSLNTLAGKPEVTTTPKENVVTEVTTEGELLSPAVMDKKLKGIEDFILSQERVPGSTSGVLSNLINRGYLAKSAYHGEIDNVIYDRVTKTNKITDFITKQFGINMDVERIATRASIYVNPTGKVENNPTEVIRFVGPNAKQNAIIYGLAESIITKQNATAGFEKNSKGNKQGARFRLGRALQEADISDISNVISKVMASENIPNGIKDFAIFPDKESVNVVHLGFDKNVSNDVRDLVFNEINNLNTVLTNRSNKIDLFKANTEYYENDWTKNKNGEVFYGELENAITSHPDYKANIPSAEVLGGREKEGVRGIQGKQQVGSRRPSDIFREGLANRLSSQIERINAEFAANGMGNVGLSYELRPLNVSTKKIAGSFYKLYTDVVVRPVEKLLSTLSGKKVALLEADRQDANGRSSGGPLWSWLKSNINAVATDPKTGISYVAKWANLDISKVRPMRRKLTSNDVTEGWALVSIGDSKQHESNNHTFREVIELVESLNLSPNQMETVKVIFGNNISSKRGNLTEQEIKEQGERLSYSIEINEAGLSEKAIGKVNKKYSNKQWFKDSINAYNNRTSNEEFGLSKPSFDVRKEIIGELQSLKFLGDEIWNYIRKGEDFVNVPNFSIVSAIQLSQDPNAFAIWNGKTEEFDDKTIPTKWTAKELEYYNRLSSRGADEKTLDREKRIKIAEDLREVRNYPKSWTNEDIIDFESMSETEKGLRNEMLKNGFIPNVSYPWTILGPAKNSDFILKEPASPWGSLSTKNIKFTDKNGKVTTPFAQRNSMIYRVGRDEKNNLGSATLTVKKNITPIESNIGNYDDELLSQAVKPKETTEITNGKQFPVASKDAYTQRLERKGTRWFFNGKLLKPVQRIIERQKGLMNKFEFRMENITKRLKNAAKRDGVAYADVAEKASIAFARSPEGLSIEQIQTANLEARRNGNKKVQAYLKKELSNEQYNELNKLQKEGKLTLEGALERLSEQMEFDFEAKTYKGSLSQVMNNDQYNRTIANIKNIFKEEKAKSLLKQNNLNREKTAKEAQDALDSLPTNLKNLVTKMRDEIEDLTGGAIKDGIIPPNAKVILTSAEGKEKSLDIAELFYSTVDKNFIDKLKLDKDSMDNLVQFVQNIYVNNKANQLVNDSKRKMSLSQARQNVANEITETQFKDIVENFLNQAKVSPEDGFKNLANELLMTDDQKLAGIPKVIKDALKPLNDAGLSYVQMIHNVAQAIVYSDTFNQMRELSLAQGWAYNPEEWNVKKFGPEPEGFIEVTSSIPGFSRAFKGLKVDPLFVEGIKERYAAAGSTKDISGLLVAMNATAQAGVTAFNFPTGVVRQALGGILFLWHAGVLNLGYTKAMKNVLIAFQGDNADPKKISYVERLIELNILDQDVNMGRLKDLAKAITKDDLDGFAKLNNITDKKLYGKMLGGLSKIYQMPDSFFRASVFEYELMLAKEGHPEMTQREHEELAAERTKEVMPTYARMNDIGNRLRKPGFQNAIGAFVGFGMEVTRVMYSALSMVGKDLRSDNPTYRKAGFKKLAGIGAAYATTQLLAQLSKAIAGIGDDDEDAARRTMGFNKNDDVWWYRNADGSLGYFSLSWANPFSQFTWNPMRAMYDSYARNDKDMISETGMALVEVFRESLGGYLSPNIFTEKVMDLYYNPEGRVYNPESSLAKIGYDMSSHLLKGLIPANLQKIPELTRAITGTPDKRGEVPSLKTSIMNLMVGKTRDIKPERFFENKAFEMDRRLKNAATLFTRVAKQQGPVTEEEIRKAYNEANNAYYSIMYETSIYYNDQSVLGVSKDKSLESLKKAKFSTKEKEQIRTGLIKPYEVSDVTRKDMLKIDPKRVYYYDKIYKEKKDEFIVFRDMELELKRLENKGE